MYLLSRLEKWEIEVIYRRLHSWEKAGCLLTLAGLIPLLMLGPDLCLFAYFLYFENKQMNS